jgi:UDP-N-acetyl-D-mannosaminuronic acid dehydrogenase
MGYSYLEDSDDTRNSPTQTLIDLLDKAKIKYQIHDPFVKQYNNRLSLKGAQIAVFMVAHGQYCKLSAKSICSQMKNPKILIDGRHIFNNRDIVKSGIKYYGVGNALKN